MRFPKTSRVLHSKEFIGIFKDPFKVRNESFKLIFRSNQRSNARLGLTVAKRQIPKAVSRNRIKRILRESFRHQRSKLPAVDIVVSVFNSANLKDSKQLRRDIDTLWEKLLKRYHAA